MGAFSLTVLINRYIEIRRMIRFGDHIPIAGDRKLLSAISSPLINKT
tara:strand:- start:466 stop:606 length:141 start_codon:yes stop_codon:yes gene_type:complete